MQIIEWNDIIHSKRVEKIPASLTIGVFDGLHLGHQSLIKAVKEKQKKVLSVVVTFKNSPAQILGTKYFPGNINSLNQKIINFKLNDIDILVLIDFSVEFSKIAGIDFWQTLSTAFDIKKVVVGHNFNFGRNREWNAANLNKIIDNAEIQIIKDTRHKGEVVSSSKIRKLILNHEFEAANQLLFKRFSIDISHINKICKDQYVHIEKKDLNQLVPDQGIYSVDLVGKKEQVHGTCKIHEDQIRFLRPEQINPHDLMEIIFLKKGN